tara:strand:- start:105 stop:1181 length:1077 start_codon:yes stop_codon:yes gene_type:complete
MTDSFQKNDSSIKNIVKDYYGKTLKSSSDLRTSACCDSENIPKEFKEQLKKIHPEVSSRYYGCGLVAPILLEGLRVLDIGCGSGRDVYLLSQLVGKHGEVIGIDMTSEQLEIAKSYADYHSNKFGFENFNFYQGYIEKLDMLDLEAHSFDLVVSNCVLNLSEDKQSVLLAIKKLLKPGGEFYFSDIYSDRRIPIHLINDPILYGECLSGSLYWNDFLSLSKKVGFKDPRLVNDRPLSINDKDISKRLGSINFHSATYRLFNIDELEDACEDYGQTVIYKGTITNNKNSFKLDKHHLFETKKIFPVCGNTYHMLRQSRFSEHFEYFGNFDKHLGIFKTCGVSAPFNKKNELTNVKDSCC